MSEAMIAQFAPPACAKCLWCTAGQAVALSSDNELVPSGTRSNALKLLYGKSRSSARAAERGWARICHRRRKSIGLVSVTSIELGVGRPHPARSRVDTGEGRHWLKRRLQVANLVQPILHIGGVRGRAH